jgi:uncharacterized protein DUF3300
MMRPDRAAGTGRVSCGEAIRVIPQPNPISFPAAFHAASLSNPGGCKMKALPVKANGLACALIVALGTTLAAGAWGDDATSPPPSSYDAPSTASDTSSSGATVAPQSNDQLDAIVAPIALYPDSLVAQVLSAAQFPDQVAVADNWVQDNKSLTGGALSTAVDNESWDPSVKALTQFPSVLHDLATNLAWTSELGEAFHYQQADVMASVQRLRAKAQVAGNLKSNSQIQVVQQTPQTIVIQPAKPDVVYVPQYNPAVVYGVPYAVPYYTPVYPVASAAISFGAGIVVGAAIGGGFNWGFHSWGLGWGGGWGGGGNTIIFNHNTYINHTTWNGNRYNWNGYHPWGPHQGPIGPGPHGGWNTHNAPGWDPHGGGWSPHGNWYPNGRGGYDWQRNGGPNGNHGLIGGNGGVWHPNGEGATQNLGGATRENGIGAQRSNLGAERDDAFRSPMRRSGWSGDGGAARAEMNRGRHSFHAMRTPHASFHGGGRRR